MALFYADEEEVWKCPKHPSRRRKTGICPTCLRDRLVTLCPDCANVRPCACNTNTTSSSASSSSSSSSSSLSFLSVGRVSKLIDSEPSFRRSRSLAVPFLRSRLSVDRESSVAGGRSSSSSSSSLSLWSSVFKSQKVKKRGGEGDGREEAEAKRIEEERMRMRMVRSRSVGVPAVPVPDSAVRSKRREWSFTTPMKLFRHSKTSKVVQERSPSYTGC